MDASPSPARLLDDSAFRTHLRRARLRATRSRVALLNLLQATTAQGTDAQTLTRMLEAVGLPLPLSSTYTALQDLVRCGLVVRVEHANATSGHFKLAQAARQVEESRVTCHRCRRTQPMPPGPWLESLRALARDAGLALSKAPLQIGALCADCADRHSFPVQRSAV